LDSVSISKLLGVKWVAIYAIGLTVLSFFRSVLGIIFSPFNVRFNHFIGINDEISLKSFYFQIVTFLAPVVVFPILSIFLFANSIVLTWVGEKYLSSVSVIQFLVLCNLFAFITYPTNFMLIAKERQKVLYLINLLIPIVFWFGILVSLKNWGINSFAIFKLVAFIISASILYKIMINYLKISLWNSIKNIFVPMTWSILFLILMSFVVENYLPKEKSTINLLIIASVLFIGIAISLIIHYFSSENWRIQINKTIRQLTIK
jgi:O-antigen/teichoic acid export membrane protein